MSACPHPQPCADVGRCRFDGDCSGPAKRARAEDVTPRQREALDAYWGAPTHRAMHEAYVWLRWLGFPPAFGEPPDPIDPPGWATLENVR